MAKTGRLNKLLILTLVFLLSMYSYALADPEPMQRSVDGQGDYFVTGDAFPTDIQIAGYDSRDKELYINFEVAPTVGAIDGFVYVLQTFDSAGNQIGNVGTFDATEVVAEGYEVTNENFVISGDGLPAHYRVVITITDHTIDEG